MPLEQRLDQSSSALELHQWPQHQERSLEYPTPERRQESREEHSLPPLAAEEAHTAPSRRTVVVG